MARADRQDRNNREQKEDPELIEKLVAGIEIPLPKQLKCAILEDTSENLFEEYFQKLVDNPNQDASEENEQELDDNDLLCKE